MTLKKKPAILPVSVDFKEKWKLVLNEAEKKLVEELLVESEKIIEKERGSLTAKINNRLSKGNSVTIKVAEDRSSKRNNSTEDKESLVQNINVDTRYVTDNRLQRRKNEKEEKKREEEKKDDEITADIVTMVSAHTQM